jgi:hypothetical protein
VFVNFAIDTSERMVANLAQEFILRKLTKVKGRKPSAPMNTQLEP